MSTFTDEGQKATERERVQLEVRNRAQKFCNHEASQNIKLRAECDALIAENSKLNSEIDKLKKKLCSLRSLF